MKKLVDFITVMPEEDEHKRGHKYPFVAAEIFNAEVMALIDQFFLTRGEYEEQLREKEREKESLERKNTDPGVDDDDEVERDSDDDNAFKIDN